MINNIFKLAGLYEVHSKIYKELAEYILLLLALSEITMIIDEKMEKRKSIIPILKNIVNYGVVSFICTCVFWKYNIANSF